MTAATESKQLANNLLNIMPSQSNEVLSFQTYHPDSNSSSHLSSTCSEGGDSLFQEENGKYDLDTVSTFVAKLYQLLDGDEYKEYLTWNDTGDVFVICNMDEFATNVLPKYFKHCKFTSFVRQLNIYGFYRVSDARKSKHVRSKHACVFSHSQFRRGRQDLLPNIKRKVAKTARRKPHYIDFLSNATANNNLDKSDVDIMTRKRLSDLTIITENLRKDLKQMNNIVNDLLPEVRSLTEGLQKHQTHLMALTQLMTGSSYHDEMPSKRMRFDKTMIKTEQLQQPTTTMSLSPSVPTNGVIVTVNSSSPPTSTSPSSSPPLPQSGATTNSSLTDFYNHNHLLQ
ncbi:961_t:CDS:2, partial [Entrophospora sp. SA101]